MTTTSLADAKNRLSELVSSAEKTHERIVITKNGRPAVAIIAIEDLEGLEETLDMLSDPEEARAVREAIREAEDGDSDSYTMDEMWALMEERKRLGGRELTEPEADKIIAAHRRSRPTA